MLSFTIQHKNRIVALFKLFYLLLIVVMIVGRYAIYTESSWSNFFYMLGVTLGRTALIFLSITLLPGISRRFGAASPLFTTLQFIRRYLGISVFMCAITHAVLVKSNFFSFRLFEFMGFIALSCLFLLFLTSNDYSVSHLKLWWKRLHSLVYFIVWILFAHIFLQGVHDVWMLLVAIVAVAEATSWIYFYYRRNVRIP